ncbi:MAG: metalloregulator ArsR/SmtB family transcription factor [Myxococcaceae bacterium]
MEELSESFRALGDPTRLRILRLLGDAPLNVSELVSLVGVAQSSVSHHLGKLKGLELIREERQAGYTYYSLALKNDDARWPLIRLAKDATDSHGDRARLNELLRNREDRTALNEKLLEPGQSWMLWASAISSLLPPLDVADFGCGTGVLTVELARFAKRVVAIDRNPGALEQAKARAEHEGLTNVTFLEGDLGALKLPAGKRQLVVISQSLHHVEEPSAVLREAARLLEPQGRLVVLELMPHREEWVKERLGHVHLGFDPDRLMEDASAAGFTKLKLTPYPKEGAAAFRVFLLTGVKSDRAPQAAALAVEGRA